MPPEVIWLLFFMSWGNSKVWMGDLWIKGRTVKFNSPVYHFLTIKNYTHTHTHTHTCLLCAYVSSSASWICCILMHPQCLAHIRPLMSKWVKDTRCKVPMPPHAWIIWILWNKHTPVSLHSFPTEIVIKMTILPWVCPFLLIAHPDLD